MSLFNKVDIRTSFPFFFKRFYIVFLLGPDVRYGKETDVSKERRRNSPIGVAFLFMTLLLWFLIGGTILTLGSLYLVKTYAGWDIFKFSSPLQEILHYLRVCHNI